MSKSESKKATERMFVPNRRTGRSRIQFAVPGQEYSPVKFAEMGGDEDDLECEAFLAAGQPDPAADPVVGVTDGKVIGNVDEIAAWIGDDVERAVAVIDAGESRKGVLGHIADLAEALTALAEASDPSTNVDEDDDGGDEAPPPAE